MGQQEVQREQVEKGDASCKDKNYSPMFKKDISNILENRWRLVDEDTGSDWAAKQMADSWPEFAVGLDAPVGENEEEQAEEEGDDEAVDGIDNADEGDDDVEFVLPGLEDASEASEESGEEEGLRTIQEHETYMAEFVNVLDVTKLLNELAE